jgi:hypothetical protein
MHIGKWIGWPLLIGVALVGVSTLVYLLVLNPSARRTLYLFARLALDPSARQHVSATLAESDPQLLEQSARQREWQTPAGRELVPARAQHFLVALAVARCFPHVDLTNRPPASIEASLMLGLEPTGELTWVGASDATPGLELNPYQASMLVLSDAISRARLHSASILADNKAKMELYQWTLIILGAITTILVSIKSMSSERTPVFVAIGILAIISSALATACSGLISFYNPNENYVRSERVLLQLRQLHTELGFEAAGAVDLCKLTNNETPDDLKTKNLKQLLERFKEVYNAAGTGTSSVQHRAGSASSPKPGESGAPKSN